MSDRNYTIKSKEINGLLCVVCHVFYESQDENFRSYDYYTGYVEIPKDHPLYGKNYSGIDIDADGGLTFSGHLKDFGKDQWFIGWDYDHVWNLEMYVTEEMVWSCCEYVAQQVNNYKA